MTEGIYFAAAELPVPVWVRERTGAVGSRRERKEARADSSPAAGERRPDPPDLDKAAA